MPAPSKLRESMSPTSPESPDSTLGGHVTGNSESTQNVTSVTDVTEKYNLAEKVRNWLEWCDGIFEISDLSGELGIDKRSPKYQNLKQILKRYIEKDVLRRVGGRRGTYQRVETTFEELAWWEEGAEQEFPLSLPLGLSDLCIFYPRNIIVLAGSKDAGKTTLSLNIAKQNMQGRKLHYLTSEMSKAEFRSRLECHRDIPLASWRKMTVCDIRDNAADYVLKFPNDIIIVDFLEIHDDFWKVGGTIRQIYQALKSGVAIVNIQKNFNQDIGRGGEGTLEKARLYLSLTRKYAEESSVPYTEAKIVSAKTPRDPLHKPSGMIRNFQINFGAEIETLGPWYRGDMQQQKKKDDWRTR